MGTTVLRWQRVDYVTGIAEWSVSAPTLSATSATGYAEGVRRLIVPGHNNNSYQWIMQTQQMVAGVIAPAARELRQCPTGSGDACAGWVPLVVGCSSPSALRFFWRVLGCGGGTRGTAGGPAEPINSASRGGFFYGALVQALVGSAPLSCARGAFSAGRRLFSRRAGSARLVGGRGAGERVAIVGGRVGLARGSVR